MEIWVSDRKHANYVTQDDCNWWVGAWPFVEKVDDCFSSTPQRRFPVSMWGNIGQRTSAATRLIDCTEGIYYSPMKVPGETECIWSISNGFFGWQEELGDSANAYGLELLRVGF
jgi:hypothetical protein